MAPQVLTTTSPDPSLQMTLPFQLTKIIHRKLYQFVSPENPANSQKGKIIVITGGGSGIAAKVWVQAGADGVVIAGRRKEMLDKTVKSLQAISKGTKVLGVPTDLKKEADAKNLFDQVNRVFGRSADVVLANAGAVSDLKPLAEEGIDTWWNIYEVNVLGLHNTVTAFIRSQPNPKVPTGTLINVNSGLAGIVNPGSSAYGSAKLAAHRYMEFVGTEYPSLRTFTLMPGIVMTDMMNDHWEFFAQDDAELTGAVALYLAQPRADYLRNSLTSVNWDYEEAEKHEKEIRDGILRIKWVVPLPCSGGSGL